MKYPKILVALVAVLALVAAACGSSEPTDDAESATDAVVEDAEVDDTDAGGDDTTVDSTAATTTIAAPDDDATSGDDEPTSAAEDTDDTTDFVDDTVEITNETTIPPDAETEVDGQLDLDDDMTNNDPFEGLTGVELAQQLLQFTGLSSSEAVAECVVAEFESEGLPLNEDTIDPLILALFRCDTDAMKTLMFESFGDIDSSSIAATPEQIECSLEATVDWMTEVPLTDSDVFLADLAPQDLVDALVDSCDVSESDAEFLLNEA